MSTPSSRLSKFRSYSYYHVLVMCDSSATANALAQSSDLDVWMHATPANAVPNDSPNSPNLGPYSPKQIGEMGRYVVLINGATDATYSIASAKWSTATAAHAVHKDRMTSIAVEGSMVIHEPKGVAFLDQVVKCSVALGVNSAQVVYVLKTFFVGHTDGMDDSGSDVLTDIPPLNFIVYDVTGSFSESGGMYEMMFVGAAHGASRLPQYSKAVNSMNITSGENLEQTLTRLQDNINASYDKYFDCVYKSMTEGLAPAEADRLKQSLRKVKYVIEVDDQYKGDSGKRYLVSNQPQAYKSGSQCTNNAQITFPVHTSIESAISQIMMMSPQVQLDMSAGDESTKTKYEFKIHTAIESKPAQDSKNSKDYTVRYKVKRFLTPKSIAYDPAFNLLATDNPSTKDGKSNPEYDLIKRNIIEFDYLYTGKNIDILEFDMKVNMGLAYLQTATLANTFKTQRERVPNVVTQPSQQSATHSPMQFDQAIVQTPIFFGTQITDPGLINSQSGGSTIQSAFTLTKHASLEVAEASMVIVGNDLLLGATNRTTSPEEVMSNRTRSVPVESNFHDWSDVPAYVKLRIKMPRENDDFALYTGQSTTGDPQTDPGSRDYARDFWFDGYYYTYGIEHMFDAGTFTQQLHMVGIPKRSAFESTKQTASGEADMSKKVGNCFDSVVGCGDSSATSAGAGRGHTVPTPPPSAGAGRGFVEPTNMADAQVINSAPSTLDDVVGWSNAHPSVKAAILKASARYGVDPVIMARVAAHESRFNPTANPYTLSSAAGLYQFISSTWNNLVSRGDVVGVDRSDRVPPNKKVSPGDPRFDPQLNAFAGAALLKQHIQQTGSVELGDLYLAHFLGVGPASKVINAVRSGRGGDSIQSILGEKKYESVVASNPGVDFSSASALQSWAHRKMSNTIKNPMKVAQSQKQTKPQPTKQSNQSSNPTTPQAIEAAAAKSRTAAQVVSASLNCKVQQDTSVVQASPCGQQAS